MAGGNPVQVEGLLDLVKGLKGRNFADVNFALREHARGIAEDLRPEVHRAVLRSRAPQAPKMADTIRTVRDRVPVVTIGKTNPKFTKKSGGFGHRGESAARRKRRRGAIAHGVVYGPKGPVNYYKIGRDSSGGPVGDSLNQSGPAFRTALQAYLQAYLDVLTGAGFDVRKGR